MLMQGRRRGRSESTGSLIIEESNGSNGSDRRGSRDKALATLSSTELLNHQGEICMKDVVTKPQEILALYASKMEMEKGEHVTLGQVQSQNQVSEEDLPACSQQSVGIKTASAVMFDPLIFSRTSSW